ncbi:Transcription factor LBX1 [Cricetulus griseus]|uniref:Transcription factor LBX1 n=1 Tax=Cricetulus griseus TaxID=10029 RepID=G3IDB6_CRIGR|nr:Transcription factor LBX1 [Cricetulus griseus]
MTIFGQRQTPKKRRKSRTAFTNHQIYELEKRFLYQKYLSPADRDQIAQQLGLTNAQVITCAVAWRSAPGEAGRRSSLFYEVSGQCQTQLR